MSDTKTVVIISKNKDLARLCEIELDFCGLSACVSDSSYADLSKYSVAIIDLDTVVTSNLRGECKVVGITGTDINEENSFKCDCVIKYPFLLSELRDMICRLGREDRERSKNDSAVLNDMIIYANEESKEIEFYGSRIGLSEYEFKVLERLCATSGVAVDRAELSEMLGADKGNIVEVYICHLRKKLESISHQKVINTVRAKGYMTYWKMLYL